MGVVRIGTITNRLRGLRKTNAASSTSRAMLLIVVLHLAGRTELLKANEDRDMQFCRLANFRVLRGLKIVEYE